MIKKTFLINLENGFHIRPATKFVKIAKKFSSQIIIRLKDKKVDGKSLLQIQTLGISKNDLIELIINGKDELEAMNKLSIIISSLSSKE